MASHGIWASYLVSPIDLSGLYSYHTLSVLVVLKYISIYEKSRMLLFFRYYLGNVYLFIFFQTNLTIILSDLY